MQSRRIHRLLATVLVGLFSVPAVAQFTKDKSATLKIDEAVNTHYFNGEMDKAEALLKGIVDACGDKCSPQTKAKAWMYVGIVRGGSENQAGAKEAFTQAKALDPAVQLDRDLASPSTQATFDSVAGGAPAAAAPASAPAASTGEVPGDMKCTPTARNIQTKMPIPISCTSAASVASAELRFKEVGGEKWKKIAMEQVGEYWQAEIPCDLTANQGELYFYVGAKDAAGEYVDQYGSKKEPATVELTESAGEVPSFPGKPPVARCAGAVASSDCPPGFPGCNSPQKCGDKAWNDACSASSECGCGLTCQEGTCQNAKACTSDSECDGGSCVEGKCSGGGAAEEAAPGEYAKYWVGLNVAYDLTSFGGNNICTSGRQTSYNIYCFDSGDRRIVQDTLPDGDPQKLGVNSGFASGQLRLMLSFDYAFTDHITAGVRLGYALGGHPATVVTDMDGNNTTTASAMLPIHAEARATYYFTSLSKEGLRPFVYLGAGLAAMDAHIYAKAAKVDIYKYSGMIMVDPGVGLAYAFTPKAQLGLTVGGAFFFPTFWYAVQPALNFSYGF